MRKSEFVAVLALASFMVSGCVTSTTTGDLPAESNEEDAAEYNYELGARYFQSGSYELARDRLERAVKLEPKMAKAHTTLGMTYEALDNPRLAAESYENAIRVAPRSFDVQNAYAVFLCKKRDFKEATKYFERASAHPENDNAERTLTNAGLCMMQKPDVQEAERLYRAALEHRSSHGEALLQLCLMKFQQQDFLSARAFLQRFMSTNRTTAGVLFLAAEIEGKLGSDSTRTEYIDQLLREYPDSPEARKVLGDS